MAVLTPLAPPEGWAAAATIGGADLPDESDPEDAPRVVARVVCLFPASSSMCACMHVIRSNV